MTPRKKLVFRTANGVELYAHILGYSVYKYSSTNMEEVKEALKKDLCDPVPAVRNMAIMLLTTIKATE